MLGLMELIQVFIVFAPNLSPLKGYDGTYVFLVRIDGVVDFPNVDF